MSARGFAIVSCTAVALAALAWPAVGLADHVSIEAQVSARLKERASERAWVVEVSWAVTCVGAGDASFAGVLYLVDVDTGARTFLGGVSRASGTARQLVYVTNKSQRVRAELQISCYDNATLHGSGYITVQGGDGGSPDGIVIPARGDDGEGGHGGGGGGGGASDPTAPLRSGGCKVALQGTDKAETLTGTAAGDVVFGYGGADRIRGAGGHDCLLGGRGSDRLLGEAGDDRLTGGSGNDVLTGGAGTNSYDAGRGNDVVNAANGRRETVRCGPGRDRVRADRRDRLVGCERVTRV